MGLKEKIIKRLEKDVEYTADHVDLEKLSEEERENCFIKFGEGDPNLTLFLKTAYEHGAPSLFCCSGHGTRSPYVVLKVTEENIDLLRKLGKALSLKGVATNFEDHHVQGLKVDYRPTKSSAISTKWLKFASKVMENPELYDDINPEIYYHEEIHKSHKPFGFDLKKKSLSYLRGDKRKLPTRKSRRTNRETKTVMET